MKLVCDPNDQDVIRNTAAKAKGFGYYLLFTSFGLVEVSHTITENETNFMKQRVCNLSRSGMKRSPEVGEGET